MGFSVDVTSELFQLFDFTGKKFFHGHRHAIGNESKLQKVSLFSLQIHHEGVRGK